MEEEVSAKHELTQQTDDMITETVPDGINNEGAESDTQEDENVHTVTSRDEFDRVDITRYSAQQRGSEDEFQINKSNKSPSSEGTYELQLKKNHSFADAQEQYGSQPNTQSHDEINKDKEDQQFLPYGCGPRGSRPACLQWLNR